MARTTFLVHARRLHYSIRHQIENFDGRTDPEWRNVERPIFEHYACGMYLINCLAYLAGKYGEHCWNSPSPSHADFDTFLASLRSNLQTDFASAKVSKSSMIALQEIRNALTHNASDLSDNRNPNALSLVVAADLDGVVLNGSVLRLTSNDIVDFMKTVRLSYIALSMYYGDEVSS